MKPDTVAQMGFVICSLCQILLGRSEPGGLDGRGA